MAVYESNYKELGFYCCGELRTFKNGRYVTENEKEIKALDSLADAKRVDEPKKVAEEKAPAKPARKPKASGK